MEPFLSRLSRHLAVSCVVASLALAAPLAAAGDVFPDGDIQAATEGAVDLAQEARHRVRIEGRVLLPDGGPARGAVVVSSAGGSAPVREDGSFALEIAVGPEVVAVELSAVANGSQGALIARKQLDGLGEGRARDAGTLFLVQSEGCVPDWVPTFGGMQGMNDTVRALAVFDDGSGAGPALYAGGKFTIAGGETVNRIAKWDGQSWSALSLGVDDVVEALAVFDDGSGDGPALYAGGWFREAGGASANRIAKWDGQAWSALSTGMNHGVRVLTVFDDGLGAGPALYAGGWFTHAGGQVVSRIAKWDGQGWSALSSGMGAVFSAVRVEALTVFDDGSGPALYAGGLFTHAGGQVVNHIAKWDGQSWSALSSGMNEWGSVDALTVFDDGSGLALYAGGGFTTAGGESANRIAKWDGQVWSALGSGLHTTYAAEAVRALTVFDDGSGPALYAGGWFTSAGSASASRVAKWDGQSWSALSGGMNDAVSALTVFDDGSGPALYAGGWFTGPADHIARWKGQGWSGLGGSGTFDGVRALAVFDDGSGAGPALYAASGYYEWGSAAVGYVAKWDGQGWSGLGGGVNKPVHALTVFDDGSGSGPALYAGGDFTLVGDQPANLIAKWDGQGWSALGSGLHTTYAGEAVRALTVFDDGSGPALYAGGFFEFAGGQSAIRIAKWDGQGWSVLGQGVNDEVWALSVFDDGSGAGPALYAGGLFTSAGSQTANRIARWDGQAWSALSSGMDWPVTVLTVFDDGSGAGPALYAGGQFNTAGGVSASRIAKWDGQSWSALSSGTTHQVLALTVFDDGSGAGPALYAGGTFTTAGGLSANRIARWDGQVWSTLGSGMNEQVWALAEFDDGSGAGPALYAGGLFTGSPGGDSFLARWGCPVIDDMPGCFGNPAALAALSSAATIGGTFSVHLSASGFATGLGLLFFGLDGTDAGGCGLFVPGIGELLLAPAPNPVQVGSGALSAGAVAFPLPVPDAPSLVGLEIAFHGVAVGLFDPGFPIELSNALLVTVTQ